MSLTPSSRLRLCDFHGCCALPRVARGRRRASFPYVTSYLTRREKANHSLTGPGVQPGGQIQGWSIAWMSAASVQMLWFLIMAINAAAFPSAEVLGIMSNLVWVSLGPELHFADLKVRAELPLYTSPPPTGSVYVHVVPWTFRGHLFQQRELVNTSTFPIYEIALTCSLSLFPVKTSV